MRIMVGQLKEELASGEVVQDQGVPAISSTKPLEQHQELRGTMPQEAGQERETQTPSSLNFRWESSLRQDLGIRDGVGCLLSGSCVVRSPRDDSGFPRWLPMVPDGFLVAVSDFLIVVLVVPYGFPVAPGGFLMFPRGFPVASKGSRFLRFWWLPVAPGGFHWRFCKTMH